MKYPLFWRKVINALAILSGCLVMVIAAFSVYEAIARSFFDSPTSWSLNTSSYILIWVLFLGTSYAFQEHGHVAVDMLRDVADKFDNSESRVIRRTMAILGYLIAMVFAGVLLYGGYRRTRRALTLQIVTTTTSPIPMWILDIAIVVGGTLMLVTLIFILLDLLDKGDKYL